MGLQELIQSFEDAHQNAIRLQSFAINKAFSDLANEVAPILAKWKKPKNGGVWYGNKQVQQKLDRALSRFNTRLNTYIDQQIAAGIDRSFVNNNVLTSAFFEDLAVSQLVKQTVLARNHAALKAMSITRRDRNALSKRVWNITKETRNQLKMFLMSGVATGRSAQKMAGDVKQYLRNPDKRFRRLKDEDTGKLKLSQPAKDYKPGLGRYRSSYQNALRLTATETNMAYRQADLTRWKELNFVTGYRVQLSLSHPREDICDYATGDYPKSFQFLGWHPRCICFATPILMSRKNFAHMIKTDRVVERPVTQIPANFQKYVNDNADRFSRYKNKPYWLRDNFRAKGKSFEPNQRIVDFSDKVKWIETIQAEAAKKHGSSLMHYRDKDGYLKADRQQLHEKIQGDYTKLKSLQTDNAYMLGGATANGKSTLANSGHMVVPKEVTKLDSDEIKQKLPDYQELTKLGDSRAANFVHEESSFILKQTTQALLDKGDDFLLDGVADKSFESVAEKVDQFHAAGRYVRMDYCTLDTDLSLKLAKERGDRTGRYVPEDYVLKTNREISRMVPELVKKRTFDELYLWDTNIRDHPRLVLSQIKDEVTIHDQQLYNDFLSKADYVKKD